MGEFLLDVLAWAIFALGVFDLALIVAVVLTFLFVMGVELVGWLRRKGKGRWKQLNSWPKSGRLP